MQSVDRIVAILAYLAKSSQGMGIMELHQASELPKSTLHRVLASLIEHDFVMQDPITKRYRLGAGMLKLGSSYLQQNDIRTITRPYLVKMEEILRETVYLTVLQGESAICVDTVSSSRNINYFVSLGQDMPFNTAAAAKTILAYQSKEYIKRVAYAGKLPYLTEKSITDPEELISHLANIRILGYGICDEEFEVGVTAIAAPIRDWRGEVQASLAVIGPTLRLSGDFKEKVIQTVKEKAKEVSNQLGDIQGV